MKVHECPREPDVLAAVVARRWPDSGDAELNQHVSTCSICQEVAAVACALADDHDEAKHMVHVPSSAHMWWRLQMRARQDAVRAAARPITVVQSLVAASVAGMAAAAIGLGWAGSWSTLSARVGPAVGSVLSPVVSLASTTPQTTLILGAVVAGLVLMPIAVYLALSD
jgi:hypothetical protein